VSAAIAPPLRKLGIGEVRWKTFKFQVKEADQASGGCTGYAGVTGNRDSDGEVIDPGAFKRSIANSKGVVPVLWQHDVKTPVGWGTDAEEDGHGLLVNYQLLMGTEIGKTAFEFTSLGLKLKAKVGLSVGFRIIDSYHDDKGVLHYREVELMEYSIVTFPANKEAMVNQIKSGYQMENKAAARTKRVAGVDLAPGCFAYVGDLERTETWKLPIEFPGDDEKTKSHIRNALARFSSTEDIPDGEKARVLAKIKAAAKKHGIDVADDKKGDDVATTEVIKAPAKGFDKALADKKTEQALSDEHWNIERAKNEAVQSAYEDPDMTNDQKVAHIRKAHADYGDAITDWHQKNLDYYFGDNNDANTQDEEKPGAHDPGAAGKARSTDVATKARNATHVANIKACHTMALANLDLHRKCVKMLGDISDDMGGGNGGDGGSGMSGDGDGNGVTMRSRLPVTQKTEAIAFHDGLTRLREELEAAAK
jgi:uncharacterized protein